MGGLGQDLQYSHTNRGRHGDETEAHCHVEARLEGDDSCAERPHTRDGVCSMKGVSGDDNRCKDRPRCNLGGLFKATVVWPKEKLIHFQMESTKRDGEAPTRVGVIWSGAR